MAQTGGAFALPVDGERLGSATDVGREFVTVTSDAVDAEAVWEAVWEEDMFRGEIVGVPQRAALLIWSLHVTCF
jgi:hypothetical protein